MSRRYSQIVIQHTLPSDNDEFGISQVIWEDNDLNFAFMSFEIAKNFHPSIDDLKVGDLFGICNLDLRIISISENHKTFTVERIADV